MKRTETPYGRDAHLDFDRARSSGNRWHGFTIFEIFGDSGELPNGCLVNHTLSVAAKPGTGELRFAGEKWRRVRATRGQVNFLPQGLEYASTWRGPTHIYSVDVSPRFAQCVQDPYFVRELETPTLVTENVLIAHLVSALVDDMKNELPNGALYGEHLGAALVSEMLRAWGTPGKLRSRPRRGITPQRFEWVLEYIHANPSGDLSIVQLAALAEMGVDHFIRAFKRLSGVTPYQYILRCRLQRAAALLASGGTSVLDVALQAGFTDASQFSRLFRRFHGYTPAVYRDRVKK